MAASLGAAAMGLMATGLVACQSILGITDRPLRPVDSGIPLDDAGGPDLADAADAADASPTQAMDASDDVVAVVADASDAASASDSALAYTFANPLQVDAGAIFNANTIVTTADGGGIPLTYMDGNGTDDGNDFPTQAEMTALGQDPQFGLFDDAFFPAVNTDTPNVQLAWTNANNLQLNSLWVSSASGTQYTFYVKPGLYTQVQLYATSASGASTLNYQLNYADGNVSSSLTLPDWCTQSQPVAGEFEFAYVYRVEYGTQLDTANPTLVCHIYAMNLNPANDRVLQSVTFWDVVLGTGSTANLVFYGATAWQD